MMRRAHNCPRAQRGASLPLVLFLFLICAMAASIVLAAGTAAAGRAAGLAESDQLYYNVTSAARVFRSELAGANGDGCTVSVRLVKSGSGSGTPTFSMWFDDKPVGPTAKFNLVERAAFFALFGEKAEDLSGAQACVDRWYSDERWEGWLDDFGDPFPDDVFAEFTLKHESDGLSDAQVGALEDLSVEGCIGETGELVFAFYSAKPADGSPSAPLLSLVCEGDYSTEAVDVADGAANADAKIVTIAWAPSEISTKSKPEDS